MHQQHTLHSFVFFVVTVVK